MDLVITSHFTLISDCSVSLEFSDHCILSFSISKRVACSANPGRRIYLYNRGSYTTIRQDMLKFGDFFFASKPESSSVDANWSKFKSALSSSPIEWMPTEVLQRCNTRLLQNLELMIMTQNYNEECSHTMQYIIALLRRVKSCTYTRHWLELERRNIDCDQCLRTRL